MAAGGGSMVERNGAVVLWLKGVQGPRGEGTNSHVSEAVNENLMLPLSQETWCS